ncbi:MAG: hypothetical protein VKJ24_17985 [Synechococcales bacterium]|nr:hypothetical protein [Synechococcales bacterium]
MRMYRWDWQLGGLLLLALTACTQPQSPVSTNGSTAMSTVVTLTQTGCQFLETEVKDHQFSTQSAKDCEVINTKTLNDRRATFKPLKLKAGDYVFRVTNKNVPYELGFYLRGEGLGQATLPKVSGGGLTMGVSQEYRITLKPGKYVFSCPLNPTPDYPVEVEA